MIDKHLSLRSRTSINYMRTSYPEFFIQLKCVLKFQFEIFCSDLRLVA